jgi:uncharacterized protein YjeT (DUF2065 family)
MSTATIPIAAAVPVVSTPEDLKRVIGETLSPYANIRKNGASVLVVVVVVVWLLSFQFSLSFTLTHTVFSLC